LPIKNKFRYESRSSLGEFNSNSSESDDFYPSDQSQNSKIMPIPKESDIDLDTHKLSMHTSVNDVISDNVEITIPMKEYTLDQNIDIKSLSISSFTKRKKTIVLDKTTLKMLEDNLNSKYKETVETIETNMALVCIHQNLNIEIIKFIKYAKIREIIHEGSPDREYNIEYFGVDNNIDKFIIETKKILTKLNEKYTELLNNPV